MRMSTGARTVLAVGAVALALGACGDDSDDAESAAADGSVGVSEAQTGAAATEAAKLGSAAAERAGGKVELPQKRLGLVNVTGESEAAQRIESGAVNAARAIGWEIDTIDAQGDPAKSQAGMASFVNRGVDAILDLANPTQAITQGLAQARRADIPVINIGGIQDPSPNIQAQYAVDEVELTKALNAYMLEKLPENAKIATHTFPLLLSERLRDEQLKKDLAGTGVEVVANHQTDFTALVADTQKAARAQLAANPDISAFWGDTDTQMPAIAQVLDAAGKCGEIQNYNYYDDLLNLRQIRKGCATAVVTSPLEADGWAAVDQLAEMFARDRDIDSLPDDWTALEPLYGVDIRNGESIQVVDESNLPPEGEYLKPTVDFVTFFKTKWKDEFGAAP
jgi:ABC-type sugar transport system substrate-binding protein